jgi:dCTP deaminase
MGRSMKLLSGKAILDALESSDPESLFIDPLLERDSQVNATGVDLRLGYDFLVSIMSRRPAVELAPRRDLDRRSISSFFQETRRDLGDLFLLYPNQVVLATTLEYVAVPKNIFGEIVTRSSFNRLGVQLATSVQPGYRGCVSLELINNGQSPIELVVGGRIVEARFYDIGNSVDYIEPKRAPRKYLANVRPIVSQADKDTELSPLTKIRERRMKSGLP